MNGRTLPTTLPSELQSLLALWFVRRGANKVPDWRDMPLRDLEPWFDHMARVELLGYGDLRFFNFRLCGAGLVRRFGRDVSGLSLSDLDDTLAAGLRPTLERACGTGQPALGSACAPSGERYCDLALPLRDVDITVLLLLTSYPS